MYRLPQGRGLACQVVAPSLVPRKPGKRVKTDRRDARKLAELVRSGELTPVGVPDEEHEAVSDLSRVREEMKRVELSVKQRLAAFLQQRCHHHGSDYDPGAVIWSCGPVRFIRYDGEVPCG